MSKIIAAGVSAHATRDDLLRPAIRRLVGRLALWWARSRERGALARLDDRQIDDVGLTGDQVRREAAKPFWVP